MSAMEACRSLTDAATSLRSRRISARSRLNLSSSDCCFTAEGVAVPDAPDALLPAPSMESRNVSRPIHRSLMEKCVERQIYPKMDKYCFFSGNVGA